MQSLQLFVFGPKDSDSLVKGKMFGLVVLDPLLIGYVLTYLISIACQGLYICHCFLHLVNIHVYNIIVAIASTS